jgi:hypothetical protein
MHSKLIFKNRQRKFNQRIVPMLENNSGFPFNLIAVRWFDDEFLNKDCVRKENNHNVVIFLKHVWDFKENK